ncbi:GGDEF domain-containing protein [Rhodoferax mekongensis]|uniref:GGDEF domain-containing protein n=1 Tax=Rhodoferax mekongensis TaxID=3068341 RepID=UPI0028BECDBA|nr:GGDEF domain-containing protein [Rhodoferax sp. TBRC 17199]MDT7517087.1 GGDEF domain-containing protein [Rhodoferax sp. TBRC 17199]
MLLICAMAGNYISYRLFNERIYLYNALTDLLGLFTVLAVGEAGRIHGETNSILLFYLISPTVFTAWISASAINRVEFVDDEFKNSRVRIIISIATIVAILFLFTALLLANIPIIFAVAFSIAAKNLLIIIAARRNWSEKNISAKIYFGFLLAVYLSIFSIFLPVFGKAFIENIPHAICTLISLESLIFYICLIYKKSINLTDQVHRDPLTGCLNRVGWRKTTDELMLKKNKSAIALIDLDEFKNINDSHGHLVGDKVLVEVSKRIRSSLSTNDLVARIGGDEFFLFMSEDSSQESIASRIATVLHSLRKPFKFGEKSFSITASIGVTCTPKDGSNLADLMRKADVAMYSVKKNGKCGYAYFANISHHQASPS